MFKRYFCYILLICSIFKADAQVVIQFVPEISGRNINGLFQCHILNPYKSQTISISINVSEKKIGTVCTVTLPPFTLAQGSTVIPSTISRNASIRFSNNNVGQLIRASQTFPEGDYEYCYDLKLAQNDFPDEQCFSYTLAPFAEFSLIDPYNQDKICEIRPLLTWQPLVPSIGGAYYQLVLAEVKNGQSITEALNYNLPLINQAGLNNPVLPYPAISKPLVKGKRYAWQVTAYKDQTILNRSEIWEFTVDCQDSVKAAVNDNGYRDLEDILKGGYYIAVGLLKFSVINSYQPQKLKYEILAINNPEKKIKRLPDLKLITGKNKISIDLSDNRNFKDGENYLLKVWLPNGEHKDLRFLYEEKQ